MQKHCVSFKTELKRDFACRDVRKSRGRPAEIWESVLIQRKRFKTGFKTDFVCHDSAENLGRPAEILTKNRAGCLPRNQACRGLPAAAGLPRDGERRQ